MKHSDRFVSLALALVSLPLPVHAYTQQAASAQLQISDIPRETQAAPGPARYSPPVPAQSGLPTLWIIGDSTVRNGSKGDNGPTGQWGWGAPIVAYFDLTKINLVNRALGGTSSRSFYTGTNGSLWENMKPMIKKGDFVMMQFGANDNGAKGALKGVGDDTQVTNGETIHSFGWYMKQYVQETRAQGATPIICSLTPRKHWTPDGKFQRDNQTHAAWAGQVAKDTNTPFVDLYNIIADKYDQLGAARVDTLYVPAPKESLHTGWDGAIVNAECVISGLKALPADPLAAFYSARAQAISPWKH